MADVVQTSPFVPVQEQSPFGTDVQADNEATSNDNVATPSRTSTIALALLQKQHDATINDLSSSLGSAVQQATSIIQNGQEAQTRLEAVIDGTKERVKGLNGIVGQVDPHTGQMFTPELVKNVQQTTAADRANRIEDLSHSSVEEQAINAIHDKLAAGDEVGARAIYNQMDPAKNSSFGVMKDFYQKSLVMANAVEKAGFDADSESVLHKILTTVVSLPESFTMKTARELWGNVKDGDVGYHSSFLRGLFDPQGELGKQVLAFQSMSAEQQAKYAPNLLRNIQSNTSYMGMISDPGKAQEILNEFKNGVDTWSRVAGDAGNAIDMLMIAPLFKGVGTALTHGSDIITGMGARSAATNRVANAFEIAGKDGLAAMTQKTAVVPDELIEQGLPTPINPLLRT
jgi:hypothetical protein